MRLLRADLSAALATALAQDRHPPLGWLDEPPPGTHWVRVATVLPSEAAFSVVAPALLAWDVHRAAGLQIEASSTARLGATVVCAHRVGPLVTLAPCRVIEVVDQPERVGFTYATLPGHPELGVERFTVVRDGHLARFEIEAVSRHADWFTQLVPALTSFVQDRVTSSYLKAARRIGATCDASG